MARLPHFEEADVRIDKPHLEEWVERGW